MMKTSEQIAALQHHLPGAILAVETVRDEISLRVEPRALLEVAAYLRDEAGFVFLENLCGVDYLGREPRFELVIHLLAIASGVRLCLKVGLPEANPVAPSLTALWPTANYQERETYDMFGIIFEGHPSLTRILMPDDWEGHPQRKDVPLGEEEIAFSFNQDRIYATKPFAKE